MWMTKSRPTPSVGRKVVKLGECAESIGMRGDRLLLSSGFNKEPTGTLMNETKTHPMTLPLGVRERQFGPFIAT